MKKGVFINAVQKKWTQIGRHRIPADFEFEAELYRKMLTIFQVGDFYYFIFSPPLREISFTSESMSKVLGYDADEFTIDMMLEIIHPDDLPYFVDFEAEVVRFKQSLPPEKLMKYKSQYNYRIRTKSGNYLRILQQSVTIQSDEDGAVLRNFVVHTDISHLKDDDQMMLSFIGLEGEPSYIDVQPRARYSKSKEMLTKREKEILYLISQRFSTTEIAEALFVSEHTVSTHRKNILKKTGTHTVLELVQLALEKGWL